MTAGECPNCGRIHAPWPPGDEYVSTAQLEAAYQAARRAGHEIADDVLRAIILAARRA